MKRNRLEYVVYQDYRILEKKYNNKTNKKKSCIPENVNPNPLQIKS